MNTSSSLCLINPSLRYYIQHFILPFYNKNDAGHQINHIKYVLSRSFQFAPQFPHINPDMLYVCVTFHDVAHHIDKDRHAVLSAQAFLDNKVITGFFSDQQTETIAQAIADHRSTSTHPPRNHYGKTSPLPILILVLKTPCDAPTLTPIAILPTSLLTRKSNTAISTSPKSSAPMATL